MTANLLILGGTTEATALARALAERGVAGTVSLAGRVERPLRQPLPQRVGGFGGPEGLAVWLRAEGITHLIDATHPFAAQMSRNAVLAAAEAGVPMVALCRPEWAEQPGDRWQRVPDMAAAVAALDRPTLRILLAVGRQSLPDFAIRPQHHYLLRLVDPPEGPLPLPQAEVVIDRGPFDAQADRALMERHGTQLVVSKNAGGGGAYAKIAAARALGLPVLMIDRPPPPQTGHPRALVPDVPGVLAWLAAHGVPSGAGSGAERGV